MVEEADDETISFFEYVDRVADERGIPRDSIQYSELIEEMKILFILTRDEFGPFERQRLAIWDIGKIIQRAVNEYENVKKEALDKLEGKENDSVSFSKEEMAEAQARYRIGNFLLLAYTLAYEFVVELSAELARKNDLGTEEKSVSQMKKKEVTKCLHEADIIDTNLKKDIQHVANRRNELAHDIEERYILSNFEDISEDTARVLNAVDGLFHIRFGEHAFIPAAEMKGPKE